jgi:membrane protein DedA with SNARE-associated domain
MQEWIISIMNQFGYIAVALLIAIENIFPPIPSEVILTFGGFMTTMSKVTVWGIIVSATIGSVIGAIVLYSLGRWLNPQRLGRLIDSKVGKILRLKKDDFKKAEHWFERHGKPTVFFCRFVPIIRSLISVPAGMSRMNMGIFLLLTTLGTLVWNTVLVFAGAFLGESWEVAAGYLNTYTIIVTVIFAVIFLALGYWYYKKRIKSKT